MTDGAARTAREEQALHRRLMEFGQAESLVTPMWDERETTVRAIAAHLAELWGPPPAPAAEGDPLVREKGMPHARASVLNLIVVVVDSAAAERVVHTLMGLGVRHPSRAIVLVPEHRAPEASIGARISAHCHDTTNGTDRVCYEEVVLTVRGEAATHLSGVVAPLLIPDLPTHIWWPGDPPIRHPAFEQLVELGDRLIVDSADLADLAAGMRRLTRLRTECAIGDLSWERLAHWQELTAQFFDAPRFRRYLPNLSRLSIRYAVAPPASARPEDADEVAPGVASPIAQALLYAGWIATRLDWRRHRTVRRLDGGAFQLRLEGKHEMVDLRVAPEETDAVRPGDLLGVRLRSLGETGAAEFIIDRQEDDAVVATNADGMTAMLRRVGMPDPREPDLLSADLAIDVVDPVYDQALRAAGSLLAAAAEPAA